MSNKMLQVCPLKIGEKAPSFTLLDQDENEVSLNQFLGKKVLIYFYPRAMTPGCTVQACTLRDREKELKKKKLIVLGISPDRPSSLKKFVERDQLNFTLLSDLDHQIAQNYGVWGEKKFMGKTYEGLHRISFVVDEKGFIQHVLAKVNTKTHYEDVMTLIS